MAYPGNNTRNKGAGKSALLLWVLFLVLPWMLSKAYGQNTNEWFRQRKTQKAYLRGQIAALQAFGDLLRTGYQITRNGVSKLRREDSLSFRAHEGRFSTLRDIQLLPGQLQRIARIRNSMQALLPANAPGGSGLQDALEKAGFSAEQTRYIALRLEWFERQGRYKIRALESLLHPGKLRMFHAERQQQVDAVLQGLEKHLEQFIKFRMDILEGCKSHISD